MITTFAGGPQSGPAVEVAQSPIALAVDGELVYVADQHRHLVYRVDTDTGQEMVVAGTGVGGFSGDGGPASEAELNMPAGLAVDTSGNLFIADTRNARIRKVHADDGSITTTAGIGPSGVGEDSFSGDGGKAIEARLDLPTALAVHASGTVYVADSGNDRIRAVRADGTIATVAGSGEGSVDDGSLAIEARFVLPTGDPYGIAVDAAGNIYIPEPFNRRLRKVDAETGILTTIVGSGEVGSVLDSPVAAAVDPDGIVYLVDSGNSRVLRVDGDGTISAVAGNGTAGFSGDGGPAPDARLQHPCAVAVGADGDVFIGDQGNSRVRRVDSRTHVISTVAGNGPPLLTFIQAAGLALGQHDNIYLSDLFHRSAESMARHGSSPSLQGRWPASQVMAVPRVTLSCRRHGGCRSTRLATSTSATTATAASGRSMLRLGSSPPWPATVSSVASRLAGWQHARPCDSSWARVSTARATYTSPTPDTTASRRSNPRQGSSRRSPASSSSMTEWQGSQETVVQRREPSSIRPPVSLSIQPGNVYIADTSNHRIRRVDAGSGVITTVAGGGDNDPGVEPKPAAEVTLGRPVELAFDHDDNLLVSDTERHQVVLVDLAAGTVRRAAGNGRAGFSGDGGPGPTASLRAPIGIAVDSAGRVLIADSGNQRLRRIEQRD